jgi:hypothetical protein
MRDPSDMALDQNQSCNSKYDVSAMQRLEIHCIFVADRVVNFVLGEESDNKPLLLAMFDRIMEDDDATGEEQGLDSMAREAPLMY